ncbi:hypothetical protein CFC21_106998 [Triticum aestivum]|uniref:Uncharacterized protein n=3 Tax=Triticinae TaxID=1648030 RepID=A0A3B6T8P3_WHEAT|nr:hypothetical protein CFC21_106998 [Triticum aestivum]
MAASALKMAAICTVLVLLLCGAGQPAMAYVDDGLACPSPGTPCRVGCLSACDTSSRKVCNMLCGLTPSVLDGADQGCVNQFLFSCMAICKNLCEPLPVKTP